MLRILPFLTLLSFSVLLSSCSSSLDTTTYNDAPDPYEKPLVVFMQDNHSEDFNQGLRKHLDKQLSATGQSMQYGKVYKYIEAAPDSAVYAGLAEEIRKFQPDIVITMTPTNLTFVNGALTNMDYDILAIDFAKEKEVWQAELSVGSGYGFWPYKKVAKKMISEFHRNGMLD